jgi:predicted GH43/DUF377 family glycosyl hydrolase
LNVDTLASIGAEITRLGVVLEPNGDPKEAEGVLNPATTRTRDGKLLVYPRSVARGNISRVGLVEASGAPENLRFTRVGYALEPQAPYEIRTGPGGYGCEDARVTFVPLLDRYVMAYTAFGPIGPRIGIALSRDGYEWERLGVADFSGFDLPDGDDKDGAFFPEPVLSPNGVWSFAFYHRPMRHVVAIDVCAAAPIVLAKPPGERECTRIAYVPVDPVLDDRRNLLRVTESALVLEPGPDWGLIKNGGGTPPVRIAEGWLSFYHGVDVHAAKDGRCLGMRYCGGLIVHEAERPDIVRYHSPTPLLTPQTVEERFGTVNEVVFPTGLDVRPEAPERDFDLYYGMADSKIGRARVRLNAA